MGSMREWGAASAALGVMMLLGCAGAGAEPSVSACTPGQTTSCACPAGALGTQTCGSEGTYGACECTGSLADSGAVDVGPSRVDVMDAEVGEKDVSPSDGMVDAGTSIDVQGGVTDAPLNCPTPEVICAGRCAALEIDPLNCGACGTVCPPRPNAVAACGERRCGFVCNEGFRDCDGDPVNGCETDLSTASNCGACGTICASAAHATPVCMNRACGLSCSPGFANCDGSLLNGCEASLDTATNCGACGNACPTRANATSACVSSACAFTCTSGFGDCDGDAANGCEAETTTSSHCGSCGRACAAGESCLAGTCVGIPTSGLALWLDAANLTGLADGARVASWRDASSNARHAAQGLVGSQPVYRASAIHGRPAVHFDGAMSHVVVPTFPMFATPSSAVTVFVAAEVRDFNEQRFFVSEQFNPCVNNFEVGTHTGDQNRATASFGLHSGCSHAVVTPNSLTTGWGVFATRVLSTGTSPANVELFVNGTRLAGVVDAGGYTIPGGYGIDRNDLTIGARFNAVVNRIDCPHNGDIAEVIIYSRAVSDAERIQVESYLRGKYATP